MAKRRPSQVSGQAAAPNADMRRSANAGHSPLHLRSIEKAAKKKAKGVGNALLPGNPFG